MNIRNIIKEELDEFQWAKDIPSGYVPEVGMKFKMKSDKYNNPLDCIIKDFNGTVMGIRCKVGTHSFKTLMGTAIFKQRVLGGNIIVESNDFDWVKDTDPDNLYVGTKLFIPITDTTLELIEMGEEKITYMVVGTRYGDEWMLNTTKKISRGGLLAHIDEGWWTIIND